MITPLGLVVGGLIANTAAFFVYFKALHEIRRRLEAVEAGHVHGNVLNPARDYTPEELWECESGARVVARACRCLGILHGARRVQDLTLLPPRDPHYLRRSVRL
jgi:hypothetical protein